MKEEIYNIKGIKITRPVYDGKIEILVEGDVDDYDIIRRTEYISVDKFSKLLPIIKKLMNYGNYNWMNACEYLIDDEHYLLQNYIPHGNNKTIHTIETVDVWYRSLDGIRYEVAIDYNEE